MQIHGPVEIARDFQTVHLNFGMLFGNPFFVDLFMKFVEAKINIIWYYRFGNEPCKKELRLQDNGSGRVSKILLGFWKIAYKAHASILDKATKMGVPLSGTRLAPHQKSCRLTHFRGSNRTLGQPSNCRS